VQDVIEDKGLVLEDEIYREVEAVTDAITEEQGHAGS